MGIDLGGGDVGVAQQLLHRTQVAAGLQHMAGKRMAQHVRMDMDTDALALRRRVGYVPEEPGGYAWSELASLVGAVMKKSGGRANLHQGAAGFAVDLESGRLGTGIHEGRVIDTHPDSGEKLAGRFGATHAPDLLKAWTLASRAQLRFGQTQQRLRLQRWIAGN